jgi:hypothetical protein
LEPAYTAKIVQVYAAETRNILDMDSFIAEQHYCQYFMAAQTVREDMVRRVKRQEAYQDAAHFHTAIDSVIANTSTFEVCCMQHDPNSDEVHHLLNESDPSDLWQFHSESIQPSSLCALLMVYIDILLTVWITLPRPVMEVRIPTHLPDQYLHLIIIAHLICNCILHMNTFITKCVLLSNNI